MAFGSRKSVKVAELRVGYVELSKVCQIKLQVPHMQEARSNSRWSDDLEPKVFVRVCECVWNAESKYKPRLSGPSIRRTIAGSCQCSRSPLQVPSDNDDGAV